MASPALFEQLPLRRISKYASFNATVAPAFIPPTRVRMSQITFADVAHQSLAFSTDFEPHAVILALIDSAWVQRLRDISQTSNARLVYMFSEHSRFGHSLGAAYLADLIMEKLALSFPDQIATYRTAVSAAALLHDAGHIAPGSHTASRAWFPDAPDLHEQTAVRIAREDRHIREIFARTAGLAELVAAVLSEDSQLPPWTWQIISGGGWNIDRGNWCIVDSVMAGVSYGKYNVAALTDSITLSPQGQLMLRENRLDAMLHFTMSRHAMYRQIYQHRVILAADTLITALVRRARYLGARLGFADSVMQQALAASSPLDLPLSVIFLMRESWWRYHLTRWSSDQDSILADLSRRILERRLFKTVRVQEQDSLPALHAAAQTAVRACGYDPEYYLHTVTTSDMHASDTARSLQVLLDDGRLRALTDADPLFASLLRDSKSTQRAWLALPAEAKQRMGRTR